MKTHLFQIAVRIAVLLILGCKPATKAPSTNSTGASTLDFESLLTTVDGAIGKRFQSMQMEGMDSATYQYEGDIQPVVDIVAPVAKQAGFSESTNDGFGGMGAAEAEVQEKFGFDMESVEQRTFTHPSGEMLTIVRMDVSTDDNEMKMLSIQFMNPNQMAVFRNSTQTPPSNTRTNGSAESIEHIKAMIDSWADMGMYLPDEEQVQFIHANLADVLPELGAALSHENADVRQRAAYVVAEIGSDAKDLGEPLLEQLKQEKEQIVQIYLIDAVGAVRFKDDSVVEFLRKKYDALNDKNVTPSMFSGGKYAEVDEKINLAGVLYVLADEGSQDEYLHFVTKWLAPPRDKMSPGEMNGYWERRWMADNSLEGMEGATEAIPLLEAMLVEEKAKSWVPVHVPRVLEALKRTAPDSRTGVH